jgi:ectoine hydroxylase-related dioxygenase (phytanoyl-CoA dioxygenase family)
LKAIKWIRKQRRAKPPFAGIFTSRTLAAWLIRRPRDTLDVLPQLIDKLAVGRPVSARDDVRRAVTDLDRDGVAIMERVVPPAFIAEARRDLDRFVERLPALEGTTRTKMHSSGKMQDYPVHEFQRDLNIYRSHDPLVFSLAYAKFLLLPELREIVAGYLGRNWLYQAMVATRTEPSEIQEGFAQWHHDARGRKVNVILLLSDVSPDGPATIVKAGSHRLIYLKPRRNRVILYDEEETKLQQHFGWREKVCEAPAGSLVFFDAQAYHRGRRSSHRRDAFQVNCMTKRPHLWLQEIPRALLDSLTSAEQQELLHRAKLRVI